MPEMENMKSEIISRAQNMPRCNNPFPGRYWSGGHKCANDTLMKVL